MSYIPPLMYIIFSFLLILHSLPLVYRQIKNIDKTTLKTAPFWSFNSYSIQPTICELPRYLSSINSRKERPPTHVCASPLRELPDNVKHQRYKQSHIGRYMIAHTRHNQRTKVISNAYIYIHLNTYLWFCCYLG